MEKIAEIIKELRALNMTQSQIADETGLSQAYISGIESGKRGGRTPAETLERARLARDRLVAEQATNTTEQKTSL